MYKLLIVDDEEFVRESIAKAIDWKKLGFSEVCQAENGLQALEVASKENPDLVLADIKMPFMNGLEFTENLKKVQPDVMVAIMTGYDDFKFAQKGIDLGVISYILKPVGVASLTEKMREIVNELDHRRMEKRHLDKIKSQLQQSLPLLKERFLNMLICTPGDKRDLEKRAAFLDISLKSGSYAVCIVDPDLSECSIGDVEAYKFAIKNIVSETIGEDKPVFCDNTGNIVLVFTLKDLDDSAEMRINVVETLSIIKINVNALFHIPLTASIGILVHDYTGLYSSYMEALSALECRYILGKNKIYDIGDLDYHSTAFYYPFDDCSNFIDAVKSANEGDMEKYLANVCAFLKNETGTTSVNIKMVFTEMVTNLLKLLTQLKEINYEDWTAGFSLFHSIQKLRTVDEISTTVLHFAKRVAVNLNNLRMTSSKNLISKVISHVQEKYGEESLSLVTVAEYAAVSAGYLSILFKKETGQNFVDYLTQVRMDKAKVLLRTTDLKSYEVAYRTGFSNSNYFSYAFKKYTGLSPSEYKNIPGAINSGRQE